MRLAAALVRHPIPVTLSVSRCVSVPIPLDLLHSASTYINIYILRIATFTTRGKREGGEEGRGERRKTDEIFLTGVKLLSVSIQPKLLFAAHLNKRANKRNE